MRPTSRSHLKNSSGDTRGHAAVGWLAPNVLLAVHAIIVIGSVIEFHVGVTPGTSAWVLSLISCRSSSVTVRSLTKVSLLLMTAQSQSYFTGGLTTISGTKLDHGDLAVCSGTDLLFGVQNERQAWCYEPAFDFGIACGYTDRTLQSLPTEVSLFFYCELASVRGHG